MKQVRVWIGILVATVLVAGTAPIVGGAARAGGLTPASGEAAGILSLWLVGQIDTPGFARGVAVARDYAYIADDESGLRVVDVSDPAAPVEVADLPMPGYAPFWDVAVQGDYAYIVADWQGGLQVVDVSNPEVPVAVGNCAAGTNPRRVTVAANHAYVGGLANFAVVSVSNPANPFQVGLLEDHAAGVVVTGATAYIAAEWDQGLRVVDVSIPNAPAQVGFVGLPRYAWELDVEGDYAYVADDGKGLRVVDVSNPFEPVEVGYWDPGYGYEFDSARSVAVAGGHAFVAAQGHGLSALDVSNPAEPVLVGAYDTSGTAEDVVLDEEGLIYVADGLNGLVILRMTYEISGSVTDAQGDPISGVTITATGGLTAITGPSGNYALVDVPAGTYTLVASKEGYVFVPESREVAVPPNAIHQDFAAPARLFLPLVVRGH